MEQILHDLFLGVINMSITGSYAILFVLSVRLALKRVPKIYSYGLWSLVLFRLLVPFSFSSALSFFGFLPSGSGRLSAAPTETGILALTWSDPSAVPAGSTAVSAMVSQTAAAETSAGYMQFFLQLIPVAWLLGAAALLCCSVFSYLRLRGKIDTAILLEKNIYECEAIDSPFVIGPFRPKIYLPMGLSPLEKIYILKHEQVHIKRLDHLLKPLAFFTLCIHWFNPLVWVSFWLVGRDMEMSCDESVIKTMGPDIKKDYSSSLLAFASRRKLVGAGPLTFGEQNAESRIRNVLNYRQRPLWVAVIILLFLAAIGVGLISNPQIGQEPSELNINQQLSDQEIRTLAEIWAESLRTRDGRPRYEMMSEERKEAFILDQKDRSDPWNYNIGYSSPWVTGYEITTKENSAEILYHMTDSTQAEYDKIEIIYFGKENGKTVIIQAEELLSEWQRRRYYALTAEEAMHAYIKALLSSDYLTILALTPSAKLEPYGQLIWDTVKITDVKIVNQDVRSNKACYELELTVKDGGSSAFEKGVSPRWLWLARGEQGWYAEGLMTSGTPEENWWNGIHEFERLLYLSPLSSSTFNYAESRLQGTQFTINEELFMIDYPEGDDYELARPKYVIEEMTEDMAAAFEQSTLGTVSISEYKEKYRYTIYTEDDRKTNYYLFTMDGEIWLSSYADNTADGSEITMYLWKLN